MSSYKKESIQNDLITTDSFAPSAVSQWESAGYTDALVSITVFAKNSDDRAWIKMLASIETYGAMANIIGTPQVLYDQRDTAAADWTAEISIEDGSKVTVTCTGDTTIMEWWVDWQILEYRLDIPFE